MRDTWTTLWCLPAQDGGYGNVWTSLMRILSWVVLNGIQRRLTLDVYHMEWTGWVPDLMHTGPPKWHPVN